MCKQVMAVRSMFTFFVNYVNVLTLRVNKASGNKKCGVGSKSVTFFRIILTHFGKFLKNNEQLNTLVKTLNLLTPNYYCFFV